MNKNITMASKYVISTIIILLFVLNACQTKQAENNQNTVLTDTNNVEQKVKTEEQIPDIEAIEANAIEQNINEISDERQSSDDDCACQNEVYLNDPDTKGTNIRETPKGKVIDQLKYDEETESLIVSIKNSDNGWIELSSGGFVFGGILAIDSRNYDPSKKLNLYAEPDFNSKVVKSYSSEKQFSIVGCCKDWLEVKDKEGNTGWLAPDMQCANPLTTCP